MWGVKPAASGLLKYYEERHVCVDLGRECGKGFYELIELKAGENPDTPLSAALQILSYGLLYCFARLHKYELDVPHATGVLAAKRIDLTVLGPRSIYRCYRLEQLWKVNCIGTRSNPLWPIEFLAKRAFPARVTSVTRSRSFKFEDSLLLRGSA